MCKISDFSCEIRLFEEMLHERPGWSFGHLILNKTVWLRWSIQTLWKSNKRKKRILVWHWPAGGLGLAGEQVLVVVGEAGGAARLLGDEGEIAAQTGHAAAIPRVWNHTHKRTPSGWGSSLDRTKQLRRGPCTGNKGERETETSWEPHSCNCFRFSLSQNVTINWKELQLHKSFSRAFQNYT